jgi:hypothetical protein
LINHAVGAVVKDVVIQHLTEPEYHFDRLRGAGKVLAFRAYGRDICDRLNAAGVKAFIRNVSAPGYGIAGQPAVIAEKALTL